jgi:hypothetical protein
MQKLEALELGHLTRPDAPVILPRMPGKIVCTVLDRGNDVRCLL